MTTNLPETIAGLEAVLKQADCCGNAYQREFIPTPRDMFEQALTHLREKEATVRECAEIGGKFIKPCGPAVKAAILAHFGLKEKP